MLMNNSKPSSASSSKPSSSKPSSASSSKPSSSKPSSSKPSSSKPSSASSKPSSSKPSSSKPSSSKPSSNKPSSASSKPSSASSKPSSGTQSVNSAFAQSLENMLMNSNKPSSVNLSNLTKPTVIKRCKYYVVEPATKVIKRTLCAKKSLEELRKLAMSANIDEPNKLNKRVLCEKLSMFENKNGRKYIIDTYHRKGKQAQCDRKSLAFLRALATEHGLDTSGNKNTLCKRLFLK